MIRRCANNFNPLCVLRALLFTVFIVFNVPALARDLHDDVERILRDNGLTGAVWSTVASDGGIAIGAAGVKVGPTGEPLRSEHRVHVGSVTKTLLATGVLRLVSEGRLALDTPVSAYLPQLVFDNPWATTDPVRLRHLLDHTAGLDDMRLWQIFTLKAHADAPLGQSFEREPALLRVRSRPGSRFSYSNTGYLLVGMVIESVTGERYERYLDQHLLRPLAMHDSTFGFVSQAGPHADRRLAMGHFENAVPQAAVPSHLRPPMQFTTTARDMAMFARFLMSDGRIDGAPFIDSALLRTMGQPFATEAARAGLSAGYGLGLSGRDRHGVIGYCHSGNTVGFHAMLCLFPEHHKAFFVAVNADSETANYGLLDALLVEALQLEPLAPASVGTHLVDIAEWQGIYIPAPNRIASFAWIDVVFNFVHLKWDGSHLRLRSLQSADRALIPQAGLVFRATDRRSASHVLLTSADGQRVLSDGVQSYERISLPEIALLWTSVCAGALGLIIVILSGTVRLLQRSLTPSRAIFVPYIAALALLLPLPLFLRQSFLQLGDVTAASVTLTVVTAALPIGMLIGLVQQLRARTTSAMAIVDSVAMLAVLQWTLVLAAWNLVPLRLWH